VYIGIRYTVVWKRHLELATLKKWEPENLLLIMEIDSVSLSGGCATILHESMRMPVQTFCMYLGTAHSRIPASFTHHVLSLTLKGHNAWDGPQKPIQV
jgi:hypothetical protein